jgi:exodeoxyribonuclease VII large subunit
MVVHASAKTPTAAAEWLIECVTVQAEKVEGLLLRLQRATQGNINRQKNQLELYQQRLGSTVKRAVLKEQGRFALWQKTIELHSPERIFKMGYSLTTLNGKVVRKIEDVLAGEELETHLKNGVIRSVVE